MNRNALGRAAARMFACLALSSGMPASAVAFPLISEVFYDAVGSDDGQSFVELYATPGLDHCSNPPVRNRGASTDPPSDDIPIA